MYCKENNCNGYGTLATGEFPLINEPKAINRPLDSSASNQTVIREEKYYSRILTFDEESSFVSYHLNKNSYVRFELVEGR